MTKAYIFLKKPNYFGKVHKAYFENPLDLNENT